MSVWMTPKVARDVAKIMQDHHAAVAAVLYGKDAVSDSDWKLAVSLGLVDPTAPPEEIGKGLHLYGAFLAHLDQADEQTRYGTTYEQFLAEVERNPIPQTALEAHAAQASAAHAAEAIVGLGNKVGAELGSSLIEADAALDRKLRGIIRDVISARFGDDEAAKRVEEAGADKGLSPEFFDHEFRSTIQRQVSDIGHATDDWTRDLSRIVRTESHNAIDAGLAESWAEQEREAAEDEERAPTRIKVFKLPRPGACEECVKLHLDGGAPRVFYLDEIEGNGTNVGLKRRDWRVVVGSTHPYCGCSLHRVPGMLRMPTGWKSGEAAPTVIGAGGRIVIP